MEILMKIIVSVGMLAALSILAGLLLSGAGFMNRNGRLSDRVEDVVRRLVVGGCIAMLIVAMIVVFVMLMKTWIGA